MKFCSPPSIRKMSSKNRGEQVLGMVSPSQLSPPIRDGEGLANSGGSPKRQFCSAFEQQDEVVDEDLAEDCLPQTEKKRKLTTEQVRFLEKSFEMENKLDSERRSQIATQLGLPERQVAVWFQNRRARSKNKQLERDFAVLKAEYEAVVKENERLHAEVARLAGELGGGGGGGGESVDGGMVDHGVGMQLQELGKKIAQATSSSNGQAVGVKIEVEVSTTAAAGASSSSGGGVVNSSDDQLSYSNMNYILDVQDNNTTTTTHHHHLVKLESTSHPSSTLLKNMEDIFSSDDLLTPMHPLLVQQLALKLESGCLTEDYNLFFAQWEEPSLFPWTSEP